MLILELQKAAESTSIDSVSKLWETAESITIDSESIKYNNKNQEDIIIGKKTISATKN